MHSQASALTVVCMLQPIRMLKKVTEIQAINKLIISQLDFFLVSLALSHIPSIHGKFL